MLQHEFEQLTGIKIDAEVYNQFIDPLYMATDMDKRPFCEDFKEHDLLNSSVAHEVNEKYYEAQKSINQMKKERSGIVDFLLQLAEDNFPGIALEKKAVEMVGHKEVIRRKLESNLRLTGYDNEFILSSLCK